MARLRSTSFVRVIVLALFFGQCLTAPFQGGPGTPLISNDWYRECYVDFLHPEHSSLLWSERRCYADCVAATMQSSHSSACCRSTVANAGDEGPSKDLDETDLSRACFRGHWMNEASADRTISCISKKCNKSSKKAIIRRLAHASQEDMEIKSSVMAGYEGRLQALLDFYKWWNSRRFEDQRRGFILPVWTPSTFGAFDYEPPPVVADTKPRRSLRDFVKTLPTIHAAGLIAHLSLMAMTSRSPKGLIEIMQVFAFLLFPALSLVQLASNLVTILLEEDSWRSRQCRYLTAAICGQYVTTEAPIHWSDRMRMSRTPRGDLEESVKPWNATAVMLLIPTISTLAFGALSFTQYIERVFVKQWEEATYVSALGLDHRIGWLAFGTIVSSASSLFLQGCGADWKLSQQLRPSATRDNSIYNETDVFAEVLVAALIQDLLLHLTTRITFVKVLITLLHYNYVTFGLVLFALFLFMYRARISMSLSNPRRSRYLKRVIATVVFPGICLMIAGLQVLAEIAESLEIKADITHPWNYYWMKPDPYWPSL